MKFHIKRSNEKIEEILFLYNISFDELKESNKHISKWDKVPPGTKLKIPVITRNDDVELMEMEPFIEDYYPKLENIVFDEDIIEPKSHESTFEVETKGEEKIAKTEEKVEEENPYFPSSYDVRYFYYPYGYYRY